MVFSVYRIFRSLVAASRGETHFDADFYRNFYPDVVNAGLDPLQHYVELGVAEGRYPNALKMFWGVCKARYWIRKIALASIAVRRVFVALIVNPKFYLERYPDVASVRMNPYDHYIKYGWREGRLPNQKLVPPVQAVGFVLLILVSGVRSAAVQAAHFSCKRQLTWNDAARDDLFRYSKHGSVYLIALKIQFWKRQIRKAGAGAIGGIFPIVQVERHVANWLALKRLGSVETVECRAPAVADSARPLLARRLPSPDIWLASLSNATVAGAFQVTVGKTFVQYEPAAGPKYQFVAGQWPYVAQVGEGSGKVLVFVCYEKRDRIAEGILISGRCSPNYFHFLIEYLSKAYVCDLVPELSGVPLIVDGKMHPQQREALQILFPDRELFYFDGNLRLDVGKLHIPSIPTYLPDSLTEPLWVGAALRREPIDDLRRKVLAHFGIALSRQAQGVGRKIYLSRLSGRTITNREEIEVAMSGLGFEIVESGTLSFEAQVRMFASADIVVGGLGAAFSNVIFCAPGTRILGLCSPVAVNFPMFASLSEFAGCQYMAMGGIQDGYSPGDEEMPDFDKFHGSFSVDVDRLVRNVSRLELRSCIDI